MSWFKRKKSFTLSWRTSWQSKVDQKLLRSFKCISRTWRKEQISWKRWLESLKTINHRWMLINLRLKGWTGRLVKWRKFTSTVNITRSSTKIWKESKWKTWIPILLSNSSRWWTSRCRTSRRRVANSKALRLMLKCESTLYYIYSLLIYLNKHCQWQLL